MHSNIDLFSIPGCDDSRKYVSILGFKEQSITGKTHNITSIV